MPAPISTTRTGTNWTIDVSLLTLSPDLALKDFFMKINNVVVANSSITKTSQAVITYVGLSLASTLPVIIYRDSPRLVTDFLYGDINSSIVLNQRMQQVELALEDIRQMTNP